MAPPKINSWLRHCSPVTRTRARSVTVRLAGAIGMVRLAVRGFVVWSWVRGFVVRTSWVRCSWVRRSWVHGFAVLRFAVHGFAILRLTISSVVRRSQLSGFAISLSLCLRESFLSLFLSLRVSGNDLKVKFWLKIFSGSKALILRSTEILFWKIHFLDANKHLQIPAFPEKTNTALGAREQCFFNSREGWISRVGPTVRPPSLRGERR